jgi:hypothetical protein
MDSNRSPLPEDPQEEGLEPGNNEQQPNKKEEFSTGRLWNRLLRFGLGESAMQTGTVLATGLLVLLVVWVMGTYFLKGHKTSEQATPTTETIAVVPTLPPAQNPLALAVSNFSINRAADYHTNLPAKPREDIIEYQVVAGDTIFGIAEKFGLQPEWVLWSNKHILGDNPAFIKPGLTLLIPPFQGVVHQWVAGIDGLNGVAKGTNSNVDDILDWPWNHLDRNTIGDYAMPNIPDGKLIFIPHGTGQFTDWLPTFTRANPAAASTMGPGYCGLVYDGPIGNGTFIWPTTETYLSGYDYSPSTNHLGIDIAGSIGNPVYSVDDGVVVYSGWSNLGYGNLIVVDHGNGWQSVYAHLNQVRLHCGEYAFQGDPVGDLGTTGNSTGPHLHFELRNGSIKVNPWDYLIH